MAPDTVPLSAASVIDALVWNTSQSSSAAETSEAVVGCTEAIDSGAQTV